MGSKDLTTIDGGGAEEVAVTGPRPLTPAELDRLGPSGRLVALFALGSWIPSVALGLLYAGLVVTAGQAFLVLVVLQRVEPALRLRRSSEGHPEPDGAAATGALPP